MSKSSANDRMENVTVACPIVYGSMAYYLGKKAEEFATHRWSLYVRGPQGEDISTFVEKVTFTLHPSFEDPVRVISTHPFELNETGWGEFQAVIRVHFKDKDEQPVDLFHHLRLYPPTNQPQLSQKKPVVAENYDEIVFANPRKEFYDCLMRYGSITYDHTANTFTRSTPSQAPGNTSTKDPQHQGVNPEYFISFDDSVDVEALLAIQDHLHREIADARDKLVNYEAEIVDAMAKRQMELQATVSAAANAVNSAVASSAAASTTPAPTTSTASSIAGVAPTGLSPNSAALATSSYTGMNVPLTGSSTGMVTSVSTTGGATPTVFNISERGSPSTLAGNGSLNSTSNISNINAVSSSGTPLPNVNGM